MPAVSKRDVKLRSDHPSFISWAARALERTCRLSSKLAPNCASHDPCSASGRMSHRKRQFVASFTRHSMVCDRREHGSKPRYRFFAPGPNLSVIEIMDDDLILCIQ